MRRLKLSFLTLVVVVAAFAQTAAQLESDEVKRVGSHLTCQCGACQENLNCNMSSGQCHFCKPARAKIYNMQREGQSDEAIIASFVKEYGEKIFRPDPNSSFWMVPYLSLLAGAVLLWFVIRKMMGHKTLQTATAAGPSIDQADPLLAKYRDAIERDTERLE
jgi:cytochrome c-type biogenesis protein CcmH/NrfF